MCCAVLGVPRRGSWHLVCFPAPRCLFRQEAMVQSRGLVGRPCATGMELAGVSRACRSTRCRYILTDAAFCACSVVWRVYDERSDRRSQEQRNAARVRDHPVHASISSPPVLSPELRARAEPPLASRVHHSLRPTFSTRRLQHRRNPARG